VVLLPRARVGDDPIGRIGPDEPQRRHLFVGRHGVGLPDVTYGRVRDVPERPRIETEPGAIWEVPTEPEASLPLVTAPPAGAIEQ